MLRIEPLKINKRTILGMKNHSKDVKRGIKKANKRIGPIVKAEAERLMNLPKSGRISKVYVSRSGRTLKRGRMHRHSTNKEPYAWLSGATYRSLNWTGLATCTLTIGINTVWGARWEKSNRTVLMRAFTNKQKEFAREYWDCIRRELRGRK